MTVQVRTLKGGAKFNEVPHLPCGGLPPSLSQCNMTVQVPHSKEEQSEEQVSKPNNFNNLLSAFHNTFLFYNTFTVPSQTSFISLHYWCSTVIFFLYNFQYISIFTQPIGSWIERFNLRIYFRQTASCKNRSLLLWFF